MKATKCEFTAAYMTKNVVFILIVIAYAKVFPLYPLMKCFRCSVLRDITCR